MFEAFGTKINGNIVLIGQTANTRMSRLIGIFVKLTKKVQILKLLKPSSVQLSFVLLWLVYVFNLFAGNPPAGTGSYFYLVKKQVFS